MIEAEEQKGRLLPPPTIEHTDCGSFEEWQEQKKQLEEDGYTYFGSTEYGSVDGHYEENCYEYIVNCTEVEENHPMVEEYDVENSDRLGVWSCFYKIGKNTLWSLPQG